MINEEQLRGVLDLVKGVLGVRALSSEIMICANGRIVFRIDKSMLYMIDTDMSFPGIGQLCISYCQEGEEVIPLGMMATNDLMYSYNYCMSARRLLVRDTDLQNVQSFEDLSQLKSKDGIGYYQVMDKEYNIYKIPMFTGFVKINKGDSVDLDIYDDGPYYMNKFVIKKKKINYPIQVYFLTLKLG